MAEILFDEASKPRDDLLLLSPELGDIRISPPKSRSPRYGSRSSSSSPAKSPYKGHKKHSTPSTPRYSPIKKQKRGYSYPRTPGTPRYSPVKTTIQKRRQYRYPVPSQPATQKYPKEVFFHRANGEVAMVTFGRAHRRSQSRGKHRFQKGNKYRFQRGNKMYQLRRHK